MPKRSRTPDDNESAFDVVESIIARTDPDAPPIKKTRPKKKNPAAVALGRKGGLKGGKARAKKLTHEQLSEIGKKGAAKRWGSKSGD
jgi:hypothetical protein